MSTIHDDRAEKVLEELGLPHLNPRVFKKRMSIVAAEIEKAVQDERKRIADIAESAIRSCDIRDDSLGFIRDRKIADMMEAINGGTDGHN